MANVIVLNRQKKPVGAVTFRFSQEYQQTYILANINSRYYMRLFVMESKVFNEAGKPMAFLLCGGTTDQLSAAWIYPIARSHRPYGSVELSKARDKEESGRKNLGEVNQKIVLNEFNEVVGELILEWGTEDEAFLQEKIKHFLEQEKFPEDAYSLSQRLRPVYHQNMLNIAGCSALVMRLFEGKKVGLFW